MELIISVSGICEDKGFKPKFYILGELAKRASVADVAKKKIILTHQKPTLLFYHIILQYLIYHVLSFNSIH